MKKTNRAKTRQASHETSGRPAHEPVALQPAGSASLSDSDFAPACLTFFAGLGFLALLILGIAKWYHPDSAPVLREAAKLLSPEFVVSAIPEPVERLQYVLSVFLTPLFLLGCLLTAKRFYRLTTERNRRLYTWLATILLLAGSAAAPILTYQALKTSGFLYVQAGVLFTHCQAYTLIFFPCAALMFFFAQKRWLSWVGKICLYAISAYMAMIVFLSVLFDCDSISAWTIHLNPVIYPLAQVMAGKTLLVNCAALYGLYPHFLQPVFEVLPLSVYSFTVVMASLLMICLASLWFFLRTGTRNDFVFLAGFIAAVFYAFSGTKIGISEIRPDPYFQYAPIRMLFPCLLLALAALYLRGIWKRKIYYVTFLFMALAILWNLDSGVVAFGTWLLFLGYIELFRNSWQGSVRPILLHALTALGSLLLVIGGFAVFTFLRSGCWPDWSLAVIFYKVFSYYGFYMLPMPGLPHLWGIIVMIYVAAMTLSIRGLLRREDELFNASLFLLVVLGAGRFGYYQGRSHDCCLVPLLYVPIAIITLLADHVFVCAKRGDRSYCKFLPLSMCFFYFCASAVLSLFWPPDRFIARIGQGYSATSAGSKGRHSRNIEFIRKQTEPGEKIFIFLGGHLDGIYYAETSTASVLDLPSATDWVFKSDINHVVKFLMANTSAKVFVVPGEYAGLTELFKSRYRVGAQESHTGLTMLIPAAPAVNPSP